MKNTLITGLVVILICLFSSLSFSAEPPKLSKEDVKVMLPDPNVIILDVRIQEEWKSSDKKITGAIWKNPENVGSWLKEYPRSKTLIFYCS